MFLTLTLRQSTAIPIEVDSIRLEIVREKTRDQIKAIPVQYGTGMRRGTIGLLAREPAPPLLPTFKFACMYRPEFLRAYLLHLRRNGFAVPEDCLSAVCRRNDGDFLELGKGEILVRLPA